MGTFEQKSFMEMNENNVEYSNANAVKNEFNCEAQSEEICEPIDRTSSHQERTLDGAEKHSAVWTTDATAILLKLYEEKLEMLETPKKKTGIWIAIADNLKIFNIEMTPDQVRWKINALTKKYKQCLENGIHSKFKYFKEIDNIYAQYNVDCDPYIVTESLQKNRDFHKKHVIKSRNDAISSIKPYPAMIEWRKIRLASRIESDRSQGKINLEKQWLDYLRRQEEQKLIKDEIYERSLKLREEELELRKKELELKESFEFKRLQQREKEQEQMLQVERDKCEILKKIFGPCTE